MGITLKHKTKSNTKYVTTSIYTRAQKTASEEKGWVPRRSFGVKNGQNKESLSVPSSSFISCKVDRDVKVFKGVLCVQTP